MVSGAGEGREEEERKEKRCGRKGKRGEWITFVFFSLFSSISYRLSFLLPPVFSLSLLPFFFFCLPNLFLRSNIVLIKGEEEQED